MRDEFNKGYFSSGAGSGHSHDFQQGAWARQEDERRAREATERVARQRDEDFARQVSERAQAVNPGFSVGRAQSVGDTNAGARLRIGISNTPARPDDQAANHQDGISADICGSKIVATAPIRTASPLPRGLVWP